jgi:hypothetical protein
MSLAPLAPSDAPVSLVIIPSHTWVTVLGVQVFHDTGHMQALRIRAGSLVFSGAGAWQVRACRP